VSPRAVAIALSSIQVKRAPRGVFGSERAQSINLPGGRPTSASPDAPQLANKSRLWRLGSVWTSRTRVFRMGARPRTMKIEIIPENARHSRDTPRWQAARLVQPSIVPGLRASRLGDWCDRFDLGQFFVFRLGIKRGGWFVGIFDTPFDGGDVVVSGIRSMSSPPFDKRRPQPRTQKK
jgi:hypothetical protein